MKKKRMTQKEYVKTWGTQCPFCRRASLVASGALDYRYGPGVSTEVKCENCGKRFQEYFALTGYGEIKAEE
jgi:transcription elongation factor Elf1